MANYYVTKTYGHDLGLSACFRQWRADSHCKYLHGYALSFSFTFSCDELDNNGWVIDFGSFKHIKQWLVDNFDHRLLLARDDPNRNLIAQLEFKDVVDVIVVERTGCEAFAVMAYDYVCNWLRKNNPRVSLEEVTVSEHGANSATYKRSVI